MEIAVYGYASLVDARSAELTLGRAVDQASIVPVRLRGWRRRFSQVRDNRSCEKTFARAGDGSVPTWILGMNIERAGAEESHNGALIPIAAGELERLDRRELRYERIEVTAAIEGGGKGAFERVYAYEAKPAHFAPRPPAGAVILRSYAEAVEAAFERLGPGEADEYRRTTLPYPVELIDGELVRDRIPEGNPRGW